MLQAFPEEVVSCRLLLTSIGEHQQMLGVVHHLLAFHEGRAGPCRVPSWSTTRRAGGGPPAPERCELAA